MRSQRRSSAQVAGARSAVTSLLDFIRYRSHHKTPLHAGGDPFDPDNLQVLCFDCHVKHHTGKAPRRSLDSETKRELARWRRFRG